MIRVSSWPARPTNGSPRASSSAPGASPMNINSASGLPTPKTVCVRDRQKIQHHRFIDLKKLLRDGDLLVLNDSRVLPARHFSDDGRIEFLFLQQLAARRWTVLVKPGRRFRTGTAVSIKGVPAEAGKYFSDGSREIF